MYEIKIKLLTDKYPEAKMPDKAHEDDAAFDIYATEKVTIPPGEVKLVSAGFSIELPQEEGYLWDMEVRPRSGLALKNAVTIHNSPGTVDQGYRGTVGVILFNGHNTEWFDVHVGDRIGQMLFNRRPLIKLIQVDELSDTARGEGGFGSSGK